MVDKDIFWGENFLIVQTWSVRRQVQVPWSLRPITNFQWQITKYQSPAPNYHRHSAVCWVAIQGQSGRLRNIQQVKKDLRWTFRLDQIHSLCSRNTQMGMFLLESDLRPCVAADRLKTPGALLDTALALLNHRFEEGDLTKEGCIAEYIRNAGCVYDINI